MNTILKLTLSLLATFVGFFGLFSTAAYFFETTDSELSSLPTGLTDEIRQFRIALDQTRASDDALEEELSDPALEEEQGNSALEGDPALEEELSDFRTILGNVSVALKHEQERHADTLQALDRALMELADMRTNMEGESGGSTPRVPYAIANYSPVSDKRLANQEPHNWLQIRGNYQGWMHSPLDEINTGNVENLHPSWMFSTGAVGGHQAPPIVNDGIMFITAPGNQVFALNAATGEQLWHYKRKRPNDLVEIQPTNGGPGLYGDQVFLATTDCFLVALNAKTGEVNWEVAVDDYQRDYYMTLAPLTARGKVLVGVSRSVPGIRGYVAAYNAEDGTQAWRTYTIPKPSELGGETWDG